MRNKSTVLLRTVYVTQLILLFITQSSQVHTLLLHERNERKNEKQNENEIKIENKPQEIWVVPVRVLILIRHQVVLVRPIHQNKINSANKKQGKLHDN